MKILNPTLWKDIESGKGIRLNLGAGERKLEGFYHLDIVELPGVDILADLNQPLSLIPDNSVVEICTRHTLEHVAQFMNLMGEIHRVTRPDGRIQITVPHFSNPYGYSDPTHVRFFGLYSFYYFSDPSDQPKRKVPSFYVPQRFRVESIRINLLKETWTEKLAKFCLQSLINRNVAWQDWYERKLCRRFPANDIQYVLRPVKKGSGIKHQSQAA